MRWALVRLAVAVTTMVALAFLVPLALLVNEAAHDRAFDTAERRATELGPALAVTTDQAALRRALASTRAGADGLVAVHVPGPSSAASTTVGRSRADTDELAAVMRSGRQSVVSVPGGFSLLRPVAVDNARIATVEVFVPETSLREGVTTAWLVLGAVAATLVLISVVVADRLGIRIGAAARGLAAATTDLGSGDLQMRAPVPDRAAPRELRDVAVAFNIMADRIQHLVTAERELAADLSHRLRTPLTVLRLHTAQLDVETADHTRRAVAWLEHEVDQIIRAARDRGACETAVPVCDACDVVRDRADFWSALAEDQHRRWRVSGADRPAMVPVARADLAAALDALVGNVFRHTDEGVDFAVEVRATEHAVTIRVLDAGPGIPDPESALRRGAGAGGAGSTGLGLDIARRVAESTGGELTVSRSPFGGADIQLRLRQRTASFHGGGRARHRRSHASLSPS